MRFIIRLVYWFIIYWQPGACRGRAATAWRREAVTDSNQVCQCFTNRRSLTVGSTCVALTASDVIKQIKVGCFQQRPSPGAFIFRSMSSMICDMIKSCCSFNSLRTTSLHSGEQLFVTEPEPICTDDLVHPFYLRSGILLSKLALQSTLSSSYHSGPRTVWRRRGLFERISHECRFRVPTGRLPLNILKPATAAASNFLWGRRWTR